MSENKLPKVLLLGQIHRAHKAWSYIEEIAQVITPKSTTRAEFLQEAQSGAFDGVISIFNTPGSLIGRVDDELVAALPISLHFLSQNSAGYDNIDVAVCSRAGIQVSNCPTAVDDATADNAMFLLLGCLRNFAAGMAALRTGAWRGEDVHVGLGHDPQGKTLGILGMGGIGRNMAAKARAFGMKIRYHNRKRLGPEEEAGAEYVDFETLLKESDVLSVNLPLNKSTRRILSTDQFKIMKRGIIIVNTARGGVIDEPALVDALKDGQVSTVGLDVFENEPAVHPGLLQLDNVLLLPHMGTWTLETVIKMEEWTIDNVRLGLQEGRLKSILPEQRDHISEIEKARGTRVPWGK